MLTRLFPRQFDDKYRGHQIALWLFGLLTFMNVGIALVAIFAKDGGAQSADGVPLDTFAGGGAATVIGVVAFLGLAKLLLGLLGVLALARYRGMIPLMYVLIVIDQLGRKGIALMKPIVHVGTPTGFFVNAAIIALSVVGLFLSLGGKAYRPEQESK
jgi:hypothetical protein